MEEIRMIFKYTIETSLDLGDLGVHPATLEGVVYVHGQGSTEEVTKVDVHMPNFALPISVTTLLSSIAIVALEELLRKEFERQGGRYQGEGA